MSWHRLAESFLPAVDPEIWSKRLSFVITALCENKTVQQVYENLPDMK